MPGPRPQRADAVRPERIQPRIRNRISYTGPLFVKMNCCPPVVSLRQARKKFPKEWTENLKHNSYTNLIYEANSLLHKLSQICIIPPGRKVYHWLSGVKLPDCFLVCMKGD